MKKMQAGLQLWILVGCKKTKIKYEFYEVNNMSQESIMAIVAAASLTVVWGYILFSKPKK